jgi:integrase
VLGRLVYFGKVADDPKGKAALDSWVTQRDDLLAGRTPHTPGDRLTVRELCDRFLNVKEADGGTWEISQRHFEVLYIACDLLIAHFGKTRLVDDLASGDFDSLRASLAKIRAAWALGGMVAKIRSAFKYAYESGFIDKPMRYGPNFKRPEAYQDLVFITSHGQPWHKDTGGSSSLGHEFRKLLKSLGLRREGLSFYTLRHVFATKAGASRDQVAVNTIMRRAWELTVSQSRSRLVKRKRVSVYFIANVSRKPLGIVRVEATPAITITTPTTKHAQS